MCTCYTRWRVAAQLSTCARCECVQGPETSQPWKKKRMMMFGVAAYVVALLVRLCIGCPTDRQRRAAQALPASPNICVWLWQRWRLGAAVSSNREFKNGEGRRSKQGWKFVVFFSSFFTGRKLLLEIVRRSKRRRRRQQFNDLLDGFAFFFFWK